MSRHETDKVGGAGQMTAGDRNWSVASTREGWDARVSPWLVGAGVIGAVALFNLLAVEGLRWAPRAWTGERIPQLPWRWAGAPEVNQRNVVTYAAAVVGVAAFVDLAVLAWVVQRLGVPVPVWLVRPMMQLGWLAPLVGAVGFALMLSITFFNRPRLLVPPAHRDQPGVAATWLRRRTR